MCCFFTVLLFFGPRLAFLIYWIIFPLRVQAALNSFIVSLLGLIFIPWTLLMYVILFPVGFWWEWLLIALALFADLAGWFGGYRNRGSVPGVS